MGGHDDVELDFQVASGRAVERDVLADARDVAAEERENQLDREQFMGSDEKYGSHWPERRDAGLDRQLATSDRAASLGDRIALTTDPDEPAAERNSTPSG